MRCRLQRILLGTRRRRYFLLLRIRRPRRRFRMVYSRTPGQIQSHFRLRNTSLGRRVHRSRWFRGHIRWRMHQYRSARRQKPHIGHLGTPKLPNMPLRPRVFQVRKGRFHRHWLSSRTAGGRLARDHKECKSLRNLYRFHRQRARHLSIQPPYQVAYPPGCLSRWFECCWNC